MSTNDAVTGQAERDGWGREDSPEIAIERLLDAAGIVFAAKGVNAFRMSEVAATAACSRGTLYRYFPDRDQLRVAYVDREAARVGLAVLKRLDSVRNPEERLLVAIETAIDEVRHDPFLSAWFDPRSAATAGQFAMRTTVISDLVGAFLRDVFAAADELGRGHADVSLDLATELVVRAVLSLLTQPGPDAPHERRLLELLLLPAFFSPTQGRQLL